MNVTYLPKVSTHREQFSLESKNTEKLLLRIIVIDRIFHVTLARYLRKDSFDIRAHVHSGLKSGKLT